MAQHHQNGTTDNSSSDDDDESIESAPVLNVDVEIVYDTDPLQLAADDGDDKSLSPAETEQAAKSDNIACKKCGKYYRKYYMKRHLKSHHHTAKKSQRSQAQACDVCGKHFARIEHFRRHQLTHTGTKNFSCNLCDKSFARSDNLTKHRRTHTGERLHHCHVCTKSFTRSDHMTKHMRSKSHLLNAIEQKTNETERTADELLKLKQDLDETLGKFPCNVCVKTFVTQSCLSKHLLTRCHLRREEEVQQQQQQVEYIDDTGNVPEVVAVTLAELHVELERKFFCNVCAKAFVKSSHLKRHLLSRLHLQKAALYPDEVAANDVTTALNGNGEEIDGVDVTLNDEDDVDCAEMDVEQPPLLSCNVCGTVFAYKSGLAKHLLTHLRSSEQLELEYIENDQMDDERGELNGNIDGEVKIEAEDDDEGNTAHTEEEPLKETTFSCTLCHCVTKCLAK